MNINLTLIGQSITFFLFVAFCWKFAWPALLGVMAEREKKIADGLEAAERAAKDLELAQNKAGDQLREAKEQASAIVEQANKRAQQIVEDAKEKAIEEANRQKVAAEAEIEQQLNRAKEELRGKLAGLAITGAEKIIKSSVDQQTHSKMIDDLAAQL
ncbi:MAG: F0F1 ATP synthase subunit B [Cellvibrionaceae bacterium]